MTQAMTVPFNAPSVPTTPAATPPSGGEAPAAEGGFDEAGARAAALAVLEGDAEPPAEGAEAKPEPPKQAKPEPKPDGDIDELSRDWARFREQEGRFKRRAQEFSAEKDGFAKEKAGFETERSEWKASREKARSSPLLALKELGWSFEQLVDYVGKNGQIPHQKIIDDLNLQMDEKFKTQQERLDQLENQRKQAERQAEIQSYERQVEQEIRSTLDNYPHLRNLAEGDGFETEVLPGVFKFLDQHARQQNFLPPSAALQYYEQQLSKLAPRIVRGDPAPGGPVKSGSVPEAVKPNPRPELLTNEDTSEHGSTDADDEEWDPERAKRRALALLSG